MKSTKIKVRIKTTPYLLICEALENAIESGMDKTDKQSAQEAGRRLIEIERTGHALDHPVRFKEGAYLKCLFATAS